MNHAAYTAHPSLDDGLPAGVPVGDSGLIGSVEALWDELRGLARSDVELAARETRRAGDGLASILAYGIAGGVMLAIALPGAAGATILWLVNR